LSGAEKKKAGHEARQSRGPTKSQNLPEGTADTAAPGGRKRCRVEISQSSYRTHSAYLQRNMPHERAALSACLVSKSRHDPGGHELGHGLEWRQHGSSAQGLRGVAVIPGARQRGKGIHGADGVSGSLPVRCAPAGNDAPFVIQHSSSWPGLSRPSTSWSRSAKEGVDPRDKPGDDG
jgi:hypothetical protein